eukprot:GHVS01050512.1.p1 GENE.GHVS01050512.1~~GHVS01050512.1.p1  ORF type:complete len:484 (+),score=42.66 GHVS01050512.1:72-1523(+)
MANLISHKMMPICKWSSLFILALLAILPSGTTSVRETSAPTTAEDKVAVAMKALHLLYHFGLGETRYCIDALHLAAGGADFTAGSFNPWGATLNSKFNFKFPDGNVYMKQLLMKETAALYQNDSWPHVTAARQRATELIDVIEVAELLKDECSLDAVKLKLDKLKPVASTMSTDRPMERIPILSCVHDRKYYEASVRISNEFNRAVHEHTSKMPNADYAANIDVLGGLLEMSTELTCGFFRYLVKTRKYFANVSDPSQMIKLIRVNVAMSSNPEICESLANVRRGIVLALGKPMDSNIEKMVKLIKDVPSGIGFHSNVVNCMNWWSTQRAWDEINSRAQGPLVHARAAVDSMMWPLYRRLAKLLVDDENTRIKGKEDFILDAFRQIVSETPGRDFKSEDWKGSKRGTVSVILEVKEKMHKNLKEMLLEYMSKNTIRNDALEELANGEMPENAASAESALVTWNEHKQFLFTVEETKGPTAEDP